MFSHRVKEFSGVTYAWCYKHNIFDNDELKKIISYCKNLKSENGTVSNGVVDKKIRKSQIGWVDRNPNSSWFFDRVSNEINLLNSEFYNFDLWGYDLLQYGKYDGKLKGKYDYHMDIALGSYSENLQHARKLSATVLLNDDFRGGQFQLNLSNEKQVVVPELKAGSLIVFPSYLLHRVTQVTSGTRHSLVAWVLGPKFR